MADNSANEKLLNGKLPPNDNNSLKVSVKDDINKVNSLKLENNDLVPHYTKSDLSPPLERVKFEGLSDNDSVFSDSSDEVEKPPQIPDGGWGWVVVAAAFMVSACADGLGFSYGLLQEKFTEYFQTNQSQISLIGSLFLATPLLAGPIMSALVDRYGCRVMTMIAGVLSTISFLLASISNSVEMLCLTFGFMSGLAIGILYVTAVVSVAFWFDKKRNLAFSLASSGIGFGTLIYSPMTHYFLQEYEWRSTIILLAGTLLNMCVCGALMRTPEWLEIKKKKKRQAESRRSSSVGSISSYTRSVGDESMFLDADELKSLLKSGKNPEFILETLATSIAEAKQLEATTKMNAEQMNRRMHSVIHLPTYIQQNEKVPSEVIEQLKENKRIFNIILNNYPDLITRARSVVNLNLENPPADAVLEPVDLPLQVKAKMPKEAKEHEKIKEGDYKDNKGNDINKSKTKDDQGLNKNTSKDVKTLLPTNWLARQISTDHHYFQNMPLYRNTMTYRAAMLTTTRYKLKAASLPDMYKNSMWSLDSESDDEIQWYQRCWKPLKASFNFKMFSEFHFFVFNLSMMILSVWFIVPFFFLNSYMTSLNIEGGEVMISIIGIASAIGIVALGWTGDQPWVDVTKWFAISLIICGGSIAVYPLVITSFWGLCINSAVFGISFASYYSYSPALLMKLLPMDSFTVGYGLILLTQGIGHLIGPPIGGLLFDVTQKWDLTFYMGGLWVAISGLCLAVIACTTNRRMCGQTPLLNDQYAASVNDQPVAV